MFMEIASLREGNIKKEGKKGKNKGVGL